MNKKKFAIKILDENFITFVIYVAALKALIAGMILIYIAVWPNTLFADTNSIIYIS